MNGHLVLGRDSVSRLAMPQVSSYYARNERQLDVTFRPKEVHADLISCPLNPWNTGTGAD